MIVSEAPGKLYVLGEYAVVEPGHRAVLIAVDRHVRVEVLPAPREGALRSTASSSSLVWRHRGDVLEIDDDVAGFFRYLIAALQTVEALRRERGIEPQHYELHVSSGLDDATTGAKFGLGSSGAVTAAAVGAIGRVYEMDLTPEQLYRLAMIATVQVTRTTSGGDLAASCLGGWVSYSSPDRDWLAAASTERGVEELLSIPWPGLSLQRLDGPDGPLDDSPLDVRVGWTGEPADTPELVGKMRQKAPIPAELLARSDSRVEAFSKALTTGNVSDIGTIVAEARAILGELAEQRGTVIETQELTALVEAALSVGWWAKSSGSGGGDCGMAIAPAGTPSTSLDRAWERAHIRPLDLRVSSRGLTTYTENARSTNLRDAA